MQSSEICLIPGLDSRCILVGMRTQLALIVATAALSFVAACDKKSSPDPAPRVEKGAAQAPISKLGDLSSTLAAAREAFNARKGEARFLTLLSPT